MGTSAADNVAIHVETTADDSGLEQSRASLGALGQEAEKVAADTNKLTVSAEAMRKALAATGGDLQKAALLLKEQATATEQLAGANDQLAGTTERETETTEQSTEADERKIRALGLLELAAIKEDNARALAAEKQAVRDAAELQRMGQIESAAYAEDAARTASANKAEIQGAKVSGSARTAANALGIMSQAALTGSGSLAGMATAAGGMAQGLAAVSGNAKLAAGAAGIGALITIGVVLYETFKKAKEEVTATVSATYSEHLQNITLGNAKAELDRARKARDDAEIAAAAALTGDIRDLLPGTDSSKAQKRQAQAIADYEALEKRVALLREQEKLRAIELAQSSRDQIADNRLLLQIETDKAAHVKDDYRLAIEQNDIARQQAEAAIQQQFRHRDASGQIVALTAEERRLRDILLDQNNKIAFAKGEQLRFDQMIAQQTATAMRLQGRDTVEDRFHGRLEQIEIERQAEIRKTGDVVAANETAEQKKRALYRETAQAANDNAKSILDVLRSTNNATLKAVGTFGENLRRIVIGAEAARALVRAATEGAEAVASLAHGDFRGAALHGAAAVQFGAAAALGARESLGGGGTGGGAGGGGGSGSSTFTPNTQPAGGTTVINLITKDPYGRESIQQVSYLLQRNGTLNVPIHPTSGLVPV
jgi:hypothetical protein